MTRRPAAVVSVRCAVSGEPTQFVRAHRLYVVSAILAHWREATRWWATGVSNSPGSDGSTGSSSSRSREVIAADSIIGSGFDVAPRAIDREVWRVAAQVGRHGEVGVFDLARVCQPQAIDELSSLTEPSPLEERWLLVRVLD